MDCKWMVKNIKFDTKKMCENFRISEIMAKVLVNRGITSGEDIYRFLKSDISNMYDGGLMKDMDKGISIIQKAINDKVKIRIIGDYDVDGVTSTYIMFSALKRCGAQVSYHIPDRVSEGYGINESIIKKAKDDGVDIIITCDNGIAALEQVKLAKSLGIKVIITDHHDIPFAENEGGEKIPQIPEADAVINPKQSDCLYPFKYLCGAGVALKFVQKLYSAFNINKEEALLFIEYAAIATVCDVVDIIDENRIIVKNGLKLINKTKNIGLKSLIEVTGLNGKDINVYTLGFVIGPCINATGRLELAEWALKLLLSEDIDEAKVLAEKLFKLNKERQEMTNAGVEKSIEIIEKSNLKLQKVLVVFVPEVHESIAGIIAGRIREKYNLPSFVLTRAHEGVKGSGRSIEGYNMFEELVKCKNLLDKFGGHPMAAGLSLKEENIDILREKLNEQFPLKDDEIVPKLLIDMPLPIERITMPLIKELQILEPFGKGNSKPVFAEKDIKIAKATMLGANKNVLKLRIISKNHTFIDAIHFGDTERFSMLVNEKFGENEYNKMFSGEQNEVKLDLAFSLGINEYNGNSYTQLIISDFRAK